MNAPNTTDTHQIVDHFFTALTQRNLQAATALFALQIDWYIPGDPELAPWTGRRSTRQEVSHFFELLWQNTEPLSVDVRHLLVEGDMAVVSGSFSTRMLATSKVVDSLFFIEIQVKDGYIAQYYLLEDSRAVALALTH